MNSSRATSRRERGVKLQYIRGTQQDYRWRLLSRLVACMDPRRLYFATSEFEGRKLALHSVPNIQIRCYSPFANDVLVHGPEYFGLWCYLFSRCQLKRSGVPFWNKVHLVGQVQAHWMDRATAWTIH